MHDIHTGKSWHTRNTHRTDRVTDSLATDGFPRPQAQEVAPVPNPSWNPVKVCSQPHSSSQLDLKDGCYKVQSRWSGSATVKSCGVFQLLQYHLKSLSLSASPGWQLQAYTLFSERLQINLSCSLPQNGYSRQQTEETAPLHIHLTTWDYRFNGIFVHSS